LPAETVPRSLFALARPLQCLAKAHNELFLLARSVQFFFSAAPQTTSILSLATSLAEQNMHAKDGVSEAICSHLYLDDENSTVFGTQVTFQNHPTLIRVPPKWLGFPRTLASLGGNTSWMLPAMHQNYLGLSFVWQCCCRLCNTCGQNATLAKRQMSHQEECKPSWWNALNVVSKQIPHDLDNKTDVLPGGLSRCLETGSNEPLDYINLVETNLVFLSHQATNLRPSMMTSLWTSTPWTQSPRPLDFKPSELTWIMNHLMTFTHFCLFSPLISHPALKMSFIWVLPKLSGHCRGEKIHEGGCNTHQGIEQCLLIKLISMICIMIAQAISTKKSLFAPFRFIF